jgi:CRISPR-associated protein Csx14
LGALSQIKVRARRNYLKVSVIAPVGTSPPVVTEFVQYVEGFLEKRVTDLTVIATREPMVLEGVELIAAALRRRYPHVHLHLVRLPFSDIGSQEDNLEFMRISARILRDQREVHKADLIYLCVAGGRKDMCITLSLIGQYFGVNGVFHIIMPDVKSFNAELERRRHEIKELAEASDKEAYYEAHKEIFDPLMYPPPSAYTVIKIPVITYPRSILNDVVRLLEQGKAVERTPSPLPLDVIEGLESSNLVRTSSKKIYVTDEGRAFAKVLKSM